MKCYVCGEEKKTLFTRVRDHKIDGLCTENCTVVITIKAWVCIDCDDPNHIKSKTLPWTFPYGC
jgi:hypothetical protein